MTDYEACQAEGLKSWCWILDVVRRAIRQDLMMAWLRAWGRRPGRVPGFWRGWPTGPWCHWVSTTCPACAHQKQAAWQVLIQGSMTDKGPSSSHHMGTEVACLLWSGDALTVTVWRALATHHTLESLIVTFTLWSLTALQMVGTILYYWYYFLFSLFPFYRGGNQSSEKWIDLPKVTQLLTSRVRTWIQNK